MASLPFWRPMEARPMRREWPVLWIGTPARAEMRLTARVTLSGTRPPVRWPCRSMPMKGGVVPPKAVLSEQALAVGGVSVQRSDQPKRYSPLPGRSHTALLPWDPQAKPRPDTATLGDCPALKARQHVGGRRPHRDAIPPRSHGSACLAAGPVGRLRTGDQDQRGWTCQSTTSGRRSGPSRPGCA